MEQSFHAAKPAPACRPVGTILKMEIIPWNNPPIRQSQPCMQARWNNFEYGDNSMEQSSHAAKPALHAGPSEQFWNNFEYGDNSMEQSSHAAKPDLHAGPSEQFWNNFRTILEQFQYLLKKGKFYRILQFWIMILTSPKEFLASKFDVGNGIFSKSTKMLGICLGIFWEELFRKECFGRNIFGGIFLGGIFGKEFLGI